MRDSMYAPVRPEMKPPIEVPLHELMVRSLAGDNAAYHALLQSFSLHLRGYYRRRLMRLPDDIEDLVQETLLAIHNHRHTYDPAQPVTAWVHAIARYKMVDMLRRRSGHDSLHEPLDDDMELFSASDHQAAEAHRDVEKLLQQLPDKQRLPIQHVKLEGMSVSETARLTGLSESAVKVGIHRGLKALATMMKGKP
jgi:RNA polymerase sigma-70 factor, ECF subfamily